MYSKDTWKFHFIIIDIKISIRTLGEQTIKFETNGNTSIYS
jgi:hypothetical protein